MIRDSFPGLAIFLTFFGGSMIFAPGGGGYSHKVRIGVCREGSLTLTLFEDESNEN